MSSRHPMYESGEGLPLSMFTTHGDLIFVSGHGAVDAEGNYTSSDFEGQFRDTLRLLQGTLEVAGVTLAQVISVRSYVQDPINLSLYNQLYREYFKAPFPARTTVTSCLPPGLEFEIECIATKSQES